MNPLNAHTSIDTFHGVDPNSRTPLADSSFALLAKISVVCLGTLTHPSAAQDQCLGSRYIMIHAITVIDLS
jgi:hypothetical protein